jgi:hypothetical protein
MIYTTIFALALTLFFAGCKKEENKTPETPKSSTTDNESTKRDNEAKEMKRVVEQAELRIKVQRLTSIGQTTFQQWCAGVTRYKSVYGFYPNIGDSYTTSGDSIHKLEAGPGIRFVKALYGKNPTGTPLSGTATGERAKYNRNAEEFCSFSNDNLDSSGILIDVFGNSKIRVIFDTDGNGRIKNISEPDLPKEIAAISTAEGIPARVIIYSKGENGMPDIVAIQ